MSQQHRTLFYGWVIVISALIICFFTLGTRNSFGIFFKYLEGEFDLTRALTSSVLSVYMLLSCVFSLLGGWALDKYGPRLVTALMGLFTCLSFLVTSQTTDSWQLFISYSLLFSLGTGAAYTVLMSMVSRWFVKKRGFALGIASSGASLGMIGLAPFATYLILSYGWRMSFVVIGVIGGLVVMSLSVLLKKDPHEIDALPDGARLISGEISTVEKNSNQSTHAIDFSLVQALRNTAFWSLWAISALNGLCMFLVFTHLVPHATDLGISAMTAATIFSLMAGINILGRLAIGNVSDRIGRGSTAIICALSMAVAMIWLIWSRELWMLYLFAVVFGFAYGGLVPCTAALVGDMFGVRHIGAILGAINVGFSLGSAIGPFIGGLAYDATKSYSISFLIGALAMLIVSILLVLIRREINGSRIGQAPSS